MGETESPQPPSAPFAEASALEERERGVLAELAREADAWVSFQGMRRRLGVHQQALTRTLRRLEADGLVLREDRGYQLTDKGVAALGGARAGGLAAEGGEGPRVALVEALLPPRAGAEDVAALLARRWFAGLRWFGRSDGPGETALHWLSESGVRVTVRVTGGSLALEVSAPDASPAFAAARPLLVALAELYASPRAWRDGTAA